MAQRCRSGAPELLQLLELLNSSVSLRHVTQSALSRRIQALETWIGAPLVDRSTYPTSLTAAGRQFRGVAEEVVRMLHEERRSLQSQNELTGSTIKIAALHALSLRFLPEWLKRLERFFGSIGVHLVTEYWDGRGLSQTGSNGR